MSAPTDDDVDYVNASTSTAATSRTIINDDRTKHRAVGANDDVAPLDASTASSSSALPTIELLNAEKATLEGEKKELKDDLKATHDSAWRPAPSSAHVARHSAATRCRLRRPARPRLARNQILLPCVVARQLVPSALAVCAFRGLASVLLVQRARMTCQSSVSTELVSVVASARARLVKMAFAKRRIGRATHTTGRVWLIALFNVSRVRNLTQLSSVAARKWAPSALAVYASRGRTSVLKAHCVRMTCQSSACQTTATTSLCRSPF
jgi:hypothetical protein